VTFVDAIAKKAELQLGSTGLVDFGLA